MRRERVGTPGAERVPEFEVRALEPGAVAGVAVRGEVEIATAPVLAEAVDERIRATSGPFAIDLTSVDFLDSSGIACLVRAVARLGREDRTLAVVGPRPAVRRVLELTGTDRLVVVYGSREEFARSLSRRA